VTAIRAAANRAATQQQRPSVVLDNYSGRALQYRQPAGQMGGFFRRNSRMATVDEIVAAAEKLKPDQFLRLRRRLDGLEERRWKAESVRASQELNAAGVTDADIDRMIMRRRREGRR
jgi:predicted ATPase